MYPQLQFHGATTGVTGSCHELRYADDASLLIDCGLFQGSEKGSREIDFRSIMSKLWWSPMFTSTMSAGFHICPLRDLTDRFIVQRRLLFYYLWFWRMPSKSVSAVIEV